MKKIIFGFLFLIFLSSCYDGIPVETGAPVQVKNSIEAGDDTYLLVKFLANTVDCEPGVPVVWFGDSNSYLINLSYNLGMRVCNPSVPGYKTYNIINIENTYLDYGPDKVFVLIGVNNRHGSLDAFSNSYETMLKIVQAKGIPMCCILITHFYSTYTDWNLWIDQANERIKNLCVKYGAVPIEVDITDSDIFDHRAHFNESGRQKLFTAIAPYL